ncbi:ABC transporter permease [Clostridiaceae bacterium OttesenSCG-928-D20]|nr:ABC transporter permease [Clostridiaceae bacterium OttesenSCG-928-D20]
MLENIRLAFTDLWAHKLRSLLTMLGVIIGIASIIAIVSTVRGTNDQIRQNLIGSRGSSVSVQLYDGDWQVEMSYFSAPDEISPIDEELRQKILSIADVENCSIFTQRQAGSEVFYRETVLSGGRLFGIDEHYFDVCGLVLSRGRGFTDFDYSTNRKVAILDETAASSLFPDEDPIDKIIEIKGEPFKIIGIAALNGNFSPVINTLEDYYTYVRQTGGAVYVPSSAWPIIYSFDEPQSAIIQASSPEAMAAAGKKTADLINTHMSIPEGSEIRYKSEDLLEQAKELQDLASVAKSQLIWIAAISLLVGGIGVMNIMLVSVTERIREIGLKKALGARKSLILGQFLTESAVLTSIGGIIGVILGFLLAFIVAYFSGTAMAVSLPVSLLAVGFSMLIGIIFGLLPAVKAANLNPIDALRVNH